MQAKSCDIFCTVVDNFGDIGVSWRLARQLANEQGLQVRLWVDDLRSFGKLCPALDAGLAVQVCRGVEVRRWTDETFQDVSSPSLSSAGARGWATSGEGEACADLVIGAFACVLPPAYVAAMAVREPKPVWLNLEYLSAEEWVEGCHGLPSPRPDLPLTMYYFFPGFSAKTGGLLVERDLLARRDAFQLDVSLSDGFWQGLAVPPRVAGELRVSVFSYENEAMEALLSEWEHGSQLVTCLLPEGRSLPQVARYFGAAAGKAGDVWQRGNLRVHVLPFVEQERYDELLWACDINFVRGEDSCVRAQWAGRPFIWHIYPQHDGVHLEKLEALRRLYTAGLPDEAAHAVRQMWSSWNGAPGVAGAWQRFVAQRDVLAQHGWDWAQRLSSNNLALNLLDFFRKNA